MVVDARECDRLCASGLQGKDVYYASIGNNPVFVEASADIALSADEIIAGKTFCHGLIPGAEQAVVVEKAVADKLISALKERGAYLLDDAAAERLATTLFDASGRPYPELIGKSACDLARRADIAVPDETSVLVVERPYVSEHSVFSKAKYAPVLSLYIEDNWRFACEKCIEIILNSGQGNSLAIFSQDPEVVEQFILKKPVGRILVNVSTGLGSIGCRAALPKTLTIASWDQATTSDLGVCYADFIRYRQIGCAFAREAHELIEASAYRTAAAEPKPSSIQTPNASLRVACEDKQAEANTPNDWFSSLLESIANNG